MTDDANVSGSILSYNITEKARRTDLNVGLEESPCEAFPRGNAFSGRWHVQAFGTRKDALE